jgi:rubrerythrin
MKTYEKTGDVIGFIADFHRELGNRYEKLTEESERRRISMLLEYLSRHEKRWKEGLERFGDEDRKKLQGTWYQYIPEGEKLKLEDLKLSRDMSIDELVDTALSCEDRLISFFEKMANAAGAPVQVKELFSRMIEQERGGEGQTG